MFKRILIPTDGSKLSRRAIKTGIALAKSVGADIVGFHVRPLYPAVYFGEASMVIPPRAEERFEQQTLSAAGKYLAELETAATRAGIKCKLVQREDISPADAIIDAAKRNRCDLIVMASHGRRGAARLLLGSETNKVLVGSKIPVLVTR